MLRATTETGDQIDDPSADALFTLLDDIERGAGTFLIVERLTDPGGTTYIQALRGDDGTYVVERREGGAQTHVGTTAGEMRAAHALIVGWAYNIPEWDAGIEWTPVTY